MLVGSNKLRGPQRVRAWLPSLVHHCFLDDARTQRVMAEPNEKNEKMLQVSLLRPLPPLAPFSSLRRRPREKPQLTTALRTFAVL